MYKWNITVENIHVPGGRCVQVGTCLILAECTDTHTCTAQTGIIIGACGALPT